MANQRKPRKAQSQAQNFKEKSEKPKHRTQAEELRAEAAKATDPKMRETLLNAAETSERVANVQTRKPSAQQ
jgi:hypothetical protein